MSRFGAAVLGQNYLDNSRLLERSEFIKLGVFDRLAHSSRRAAANSLGPLHQYRPADLML